ncbi:MAG TPA: tRNA uridine-5-carboxymethylaminomethyl(34) synthesis GTPase MnmE [Candidatus Limnocylindria bacterium]|nr:tRNA uridine-5-carboxymethylaminomethyl(34) synthesis GTPase MnmE [Candidatus Limnocylindria bacterium]
MNLDDTIAAIATAPGAAGLAVVRVSGSSALPIAAAVFRGAAPLTAAGSHTLHHGWAHRPARGTPGEPSSPPIDEVVAAVFKAPRSYTREDVVEISCHGGAFAARHVLAALLASGARLARPGEFTLRAFIHGRLDLAQAEAVADLIRAETERAHALALAQLAGALSRRLDAIGERIADAVAEVEARVDFAEDVGGIEVPPHVVAAIAAVDAELAELLAGSAYARAVREGVRVPLVGRPNVGKSSLFNALLGEERAIVTPIAGTTRDRVSEAIEIAGIRVTLSDTAGLREDAENVEAIGIAVARQAIAQSPVVLWVVDGSEPLGDEDRAIAARLPGKRVLVALNKIDRGRTVHREDVERLLNGAPRRTVMVSAARGEGLADLHRALAELLDVGPERGATGGALGNLRHAEALERAREALARARSAAGERMPGEIVAIELREALHAIGEVTGKSAGEDLLERIFSRFCVGK